MTQQEIEKVRPGRSEQQRRIDEIHVNVLLGVLDEDEAGIQIAEIRSR